MGRPKGGKNNYHSKEEKIKIVKEMLDSNLSPLDIERKYNISHSLAGKWRKRLFRKRRRFSNESKETRKSINEIFS